MFSRYMYINTTHMLFVVIENKGTTSTKKHLAWLAI